MRLSAQVALIPSNPQDERLATLEERVLALHELGALTDDEFATAKARLLGG